VTETNYTIATLFGGSDGLERVERNISQRIRRLPGFKNLTKINETRAP
jgi:hypothetical protein